MTRPLILAIALAADLSACAAAAVPAPRSAAYVQAKRIVASAASEGLAEGSAVTAATARDAPGRGRRKHGAATPLARAGRLTGSQVQEPTSEAYVGAVQVYPWSEGALYRLYTAPGEISDIALQAGENLVSVAAGDTARWVIGDMASGSGAARRTHVLVKPSAAGLSTNLIIATDRRVYHVEIESHAAGSMPSIAWSYPEDPLLALNEAGASSIASDVAVDELNFDYRIEGDRPEWRPLRAFDDGRQVFIEFRPGLAQAPPLFVTGADGQAELVNFRMKGRYYVVDRLFGAAELRLGGKRQQVVRIVRDDLRRERNAS